MSEKLAGEFLSRTFAKTTMWYRISSISLQLERDICREGIFKIN
jgi:hypothetical protein